PSFRLHAELGHSAAAGPVSRQRPPTGFASAAMGRRAQLRLLSVSSATGSILPTGHIPPFFHRRNPSVLARPVAYGAITNAHIT
nr:hypothetical protein [Tanacetum cinerariifolium]